MTQPVIYDKKKQDIVIRYPGNPILTKDDVPATARLEDLIDACFNR